MLRATYAEVHEIEVSTTTAAVKLVKEAITRKNSLARDLNPNARYNEHAGSMVSFENRHYKISISYSEEADKHTEPFDPRRASIVFTSNIALTSKFESAGEVETTSLKRFLDSLGFDSEKCEDKGLKHALVPYEADAIYLLPDPIIGAGVNLMSLLEKLSVSASYYMNTVESAQRDAAERLKLRLGPTFVRTNPFSRGATL
jgi:hypothetical protein